MEKIQEQKIKYKLKPVWQFQSIEFEVEATKAELPQVMDLYSEVLSKLMEITPEQKKEILPTVKLASDKQKETMRKFDIPFTLKTTAEEAQKLIQESVDKLKK